MDAHSNVHTFVGRMGSRVFLFLGPAVACRSVPGALCPPPSLEAPPSSAQGPAHLGNLALNSEVAAVGMFVALHTCVVTHPHQGMSREEMLVPILR
jgi:hypothetical protein